MKKPLSVRNFRKDDDRKSSKGWAILFVCFLLLISFAFYFFKSGNKDSTTSLSKPQEVQEKKEILAEIVDESLREVEKEVKVEKEAIKSINEKKLFEKLDEQLKNKKFHNSITDLKSNLSQLQFKMIFSQLFYYYGVMEFKNGNFKDSIALLLTSKECFPLSRIDISIAGVYIKMNDLNNAEKFLIAHLSKFPDEEDALLKLAGVYYFNNDLESCKKTIDAILRLNPANEKVKHLYSKVYKEKELEKKFETKTTSHFIVKYEGAENPDVGYLVTILLEEAATKIEHFFSYKPEDKIIVILYTGQQFFDITRSPGWAGGLFDGKIRIPVAGANKGTEELEKTLTHEYVHALIFRITRGNAPIWLHEGLAQMLEGGKLSGYFYNIEKAVATFEKPPSISRLSGSFMYLPPPLVPIAYNISLSFVKYISDEYGKMKMQEFLSILAKGVPYQKAFKEAFLIDIDDAERNWLNMLKNKNF